MLYGRRGGQLVGRCLLALTDAGQLLAFHPYAHDAAIGFHLAVRDHVAALAGRMGCQVATAGRVTRLLGRDWYDDGVRDLVGRFAAMEGAAFVAAVQEVAPSGLVALLESTLGRPLDDLTLPVVLGVPALQQRPELIQPLAPYLLAARALPEHVALNAAGLALQNDDLPLADRLLAGLAARGQFQHSAWSWGRVLARTRPSFTLARLRQTRSPGVRSLDDETGERLAVAALALETLHRPRQAAALYRRAIADEAWLADELRPRLAALEERL